MKPSRAPRFYKTVSVAPGKPGGGRDHGVYLDGRPIRTPGGQRLAVPSAPCAEAIAAEWRAQSERIDVATMPLTQLASTTLDRVGPHAAAVIEMLLGYAGADLLCYRAETPADLVTRQHRQWQPLLDWAAARWDAHLVVTSGIVPVPQPAAALDALRRALEAFDPWELAGLAVIAQACGSLVLALALVDGHIDADTAFALSQLDELYQSERWGEDHEAAQRRQRLHSEIGEAWRFLALIGEEPAQASGTKDRGTGGIA